MIIRNILEANIKTVYIADGDTEKQVTLLTALTTLIGLPNRILDEKAGQSFKNIGLNYIGYQQGASRPRHVLNAVLLILLNTAAWPFKFAINIAKLVTEVLTGTLSDIFLGFGATTLDAAKKGKFLTMIGLGIPAIISLFIGYVFEAAKLVGSCITSPVRNLKSTWSNKALPWYEKAFLSILSIAVTAVFYGFVLPLGIQGILPYMPAAIINAYSVTQIGSVVLAAAATAVATPIASVFSYGIDYLRAKWYERKLEAVVETQAVVADVPDQGPSAAPLLTTAQVLVATTILAPAPLATEVPSTPAPLTPAPSSSFLSGVISWFSPITSAQSPRLSDKQVAQLAAMPSLF